MRFKNPFLDLYLEYVEETESPRIFHIFAALAGISACLGRRAYLQWGNDQLFANMYVALVGPPGVRKSSAISVMRKRLKTATGIRFAPDDTGGKRQGLISAIKDENDEETQKLIGEIDVANAASLDKLANLDLGRFVDPRDKNILFICASEMNSFLGNDVLDMLPFLVKLFDGEDYDYRLKGSQLTLQNPLLSILGGTTPQNIATSMPPEAVGQGFMSRLLLVYGNRKYKSIPRPKPLDPNLEKQIEHTYHFLGSEFEGEFAENRQASELFDHLYDEKPDIDDPRFVYYAERRHIHLIKLALCLAAARRSLTIEAQDVEEARVILAACEKCMPEALGEFGMSKLSAAKQKLVDFLRHAKEPVSTNVLYAVMSRDMTMVDFRNSIADLCNAGKIVDVKTGLGQAYVYRDAKSSEAEEILQLLSSHKQDTLDDAAE